MGFRLVPPEGLNCSGIQPAFINRHVARVACLGASNLCHPKAGIAVDFDLCLLTGMWLELRILG